MTFGTISSAPYLEEYASAAAPLGPTSGDTYVNFVQTSVFGPTSSNEFQVGTAGGVVLRGPQFRRNTVALDRFSSSLTSVLNVFEDLDLMTTGTTTIYTVPAGKSASILGCLLRVKSSRAVTADSDVSVGINPSTINLFSVETLTEVRGVSDVWSFWKDKSVGLLAAGGQLIDLNVSVAATAAALTCDVFIIGLLI